MTEKQRDECKRILYLFSEICPGLEVPDITDDLYRWVCEAGAELVKRNSRFTDLFVKVSKSDYLMGRKDGKRFVAQLGWILKPETVSNILAGKYDDRQKDTPSGRTIRTRDNEDDIGYKYLDYLPYSGYIPQYKPNVQKAGDNA